MLIEVTLVFAALFCIGGMFVGLVVGWFLSEKYNEYMDLKTAQVTNHPEMYDQDGNLLDTQLTALRFVIDDNLYYEEED